VLDRVRPVLAPWTAAVHHLGPLGAGQVGKTVNNLIHWAQISAITEALGLAAAHGLDVATVRAALRDGPTDSRTLRELERMRFTWWAKDLDNADRMADAVGVRLPVAAVSREVMARTSVADVLDLLGVRGPAGPVGGGNSALEPGQLRAKLANG
jgi:3-hydroxyisobutyrate dehydrogenase-like beta-hydroxyacid dehydrogenase